MLPIRDINPSRTRPVVNYVLIAANIAMFVWALAQPNWHDLSLIPLELTRHPVDEAFTVLTSMFMHANLAHLAGNLWFLWIFGDNVEDALGRGRYLGFYLAGGLAAAAAQVVVDPSTVVPMVGASGAIAAVTGGYVVLYPRAPILIVNPIPLLWLFMGFVLLVPAWLVAAEFFVMNALGGLAAVGERLASEGKAPTGGVAVFAHLGGFFAGLLLIRPLIRGRDRVQRTAWDGWKPPSRR